MWLLIGVGIIAVVAVYWVWASKRHVATLTVEELAARQEATAARNAKRIERQVRYQKQRDARKRPISKVGVTTGGNGLACPKCGGSQFKARRSTKARVGVVATGLVGAVATKQRLVQCVTCGTKYGRG